MNKGILYLLPCYLGEESSVELFSPQAVSLYKSLLNFIVENEKSARRFIKFIHPEVNQSHLQISTLDKNTDYFELKEVVKPLLAGKSVGYLSEAGMPCVADPGNILVRFAHQNNIKVVPVNGPSSILLALIASGMNGQNFTFHGYLPIEKLEKRKKIKSIEKASKDFESAQIFMETPYRNNAILDEIVTVCNSETLLCLASEITLETEFISTKTISEWKKNLPDLHKKPCIFIIQADF